MITRLREWFDFHRTAKSRLARQSAAIEYWMNEAMQLERQYGEAEPWFTVTPEGAMRAVVENDASYLGEYPPFGFDEYPPNDGSPHRHEGPGL